MGVEAKLQPSDPPKALRQRMGYVQLNLLNTLVIPHDLKDVEASKWAFSTNEPPSQPQRKQRVGKNEVVYLIDGRETLPQFQWEIEQTNGKDDFVYLLGWYLDIDFVLPDWTSDDGSVQKGKTMRQLLTEAGKRNVQIRIMLDGAPHNPIINARAARFTLYGLDEAAGPPAPPEPQPPPPYELIDVHKSRRNPEYDIYWKNYREKYKDQIEAREKYESESRKNAPDHPDTAGVVDSKYAPPLGCHHQKVLLVMRGGRLTAFCGGVDINPDRVQATEPGRPMHDVHCRIRGPAAWDVLQIFLDRWDDCISNPGPDNEGYVDRLKDILADPKELRGKKVNYQAPCGKFSVQIARTTGHIRSNPYSFAPEGERSIRELLHTGIRQAQRFIYVEDQYLVNMEVAGWLSQHLSHIQHLTILVPPPDLTSPGSYINKRKAFIEKLQEGGADKVRIYCLNKDSALCSTYIHAKTWIFDDKFAIIGSANCNNRGIKHDSEVCAGIFDPSSDDQLTYTLPHRLRMQLWAHHLGLDEAEVADGVASADLWKEICRSPGARVTDYVTPPGLAPLRRAESISVGWWVEDTL